MPKLKLASRRSGLRPRRTETTISAAHTGFMGKATSAGRTVERRVQAGLCLPGNGRDMDGQSGIAFPQRSSLPCGIAVSPRGFDLHDARRNCRSG